MNITVKQASDRLGFKFAAGKNEEDKQITGVYICDLLSWVMGNAAEGSAWITIQGHINIVAVALLAGISCIIIAEGGDVDVATIEKADEEGVMILTSDLPAYEIARKFALL